VRFKIWRSISSKKKKLDIYFFCSHVFLFIFWTKIAIRQKKLLSFFKIVLSWFLFICMIHLFNELFIFGGGDWLFVGLGYPLWMLCAIEELDKGLKNHVHATLPFSFSSTCVMSRQHVSLWKLYARVYAFVQLIY
jgi:hypothetical protein